MPFVSKQQLKLCYALKRVGKNKSWDCDEWLSQTNVSSLPDYSPLTKSKSKKEGSRERSSLQRSKSKERSRKRRSLQRSKSKK